MKDKRMKDQRIENNGREARRLMNGNIIQWFILAVVAGGFSFGGATFISKDTSDIKIRTAELEQKIETLRSVGTLDRYRLEEKYDNLKEDIKELKEEFRKYQEEQRAVNKTLMNTMRKILEKQK